MSRLRILLLRLYKRILVDAYCRGFISFATVERAFARLPIKHL